LPPTFYAFDKLHSQKDDISIWMQLFSDRGEDNSQLLVTVAYILWDIDCLLVLLKHILMPYTA